MKGIKMSDCRFYVNEAERVVICVIPNTKLMMEDFILDNFNFPELDFTVYSGLRKKIQMPCSFVGKAVCMPEDEWDEETGRLIAFSKAKDKCYKSFFRRANVFVQAIDRRLGDMINVFNDFGLKLDSKREALEKHIENKIKKEGDA